MKLCIGEESEEMHDPIVHEDGDCPLCWTIWHMRRYRDRATKAENSLAELHKEVKELREKLDVAEYYSSLVG